MKALKNIVSFAAIVCFMSQTHAFSVESVPPAGHGVERRIGKTEALQRTKVLLKRECNLSREPMSTDILNQLGCGDPRALVRPINLVDFADVGADLRLGDLQFDRKTTVADLRDIIFRSIK